MPLKIFKCFKLKIYKLKTHGTYTFNFNYLNIVQLIEQIDIYSDRTKK